MATLRHTRAYHEATISPAAARQAVDDAQARIATGAPDTAAALADAERRLARAREQMSRVVEVTEATQEYRRSR